MAMNSNSLIGMFMAFANQLRFRTLFLVVTGLFIIEFLVPDFLPMIDEIILALLAIILANWKKERTRKMPGDVIEGEVIKEDES